MNILSAPAAAKIAVAIFAGAIVVGGAAAASAAVGETLYEVVSATEETPTGDEVTDPVLDEGEDGDEGDEGETTETKGPDATGKAAFGLCNARSHGGLPEHSTAGAALDEAGDGDVEGYCATVTKNGHHDEADGDDAEGEDADGDDAETDDATQGDDAQDAATHGKSGTHGNGNGNGHGGGKKH